MTADVQWITATGAVYDLDRLSAANVATTGQHLGGKLGRYLPPVTARYEPIAGNDGQRLVDIRLNGREVTIPFAVVATDAASCRAAVQAWARLLNPTAGDGRLRVNDSSPARELVCRYVGGLEGRETDEDRGLYSYRAALILRAEVPYWQAITEDAATFTYSSSGTPFFPFFPLRLSAGSTLAGSTVSNDGDVDTWPLVTLDGPFTSITLRNTTTGQRITIDHTATAGETITVDFAPRTRAITKAGTNLWSALSVREFWPLVPGTNTITIEGAGFDANSAADLTWREQFLSV